MYSRRDDECGALFAWLDVALCACRLSPRQLMIAMNYESFVEQRRVEFCATDSGANVNSRYWVTFYIIGPTLPVAFRCSLWSCACGLVSATKRAVSSVNCSSRLIASQSLICSSDRLEAIDRASDPVIRRGRFNNSPTGALTALHH